ncbi:MAG: carbamoyltransferase HypF, partial [Candidatus Omnitrophota bacterium]
MKNKTIFAAGADIKNKFIVAKGHDLYLGPDITDLSSAENYELFKQEVRKATEENKPDIIACDLHPGYFSTKFAKECSLQLATCSLQPVQHHHAHIASVMHECGLEGPVIGFSFDVTGYGTDSNIWGGEFLLVQRDGFERATHLKYWKMPGGDKAVSEPWRM